MRPTTLTTPVTRKLRHIYLAVRFRSNRNRVVTDQLKISNTKLDDKVFT
ncbi:Uncharacterised protein [Mycobacteroides abscessus]|nr:Uncharacterised protein [Mycobacteroides abscessus]CPZ85402.1 Uncharacterised protein [Mycobacteroides abscessus]SHT56132.1 Uncharacterised protein [Mycobacteroides abscessus subsp. abscessus]SIM70090.1 Uncharacterised protein [Mycobacteroides abscessus subsp. abscessus]SKY69336.1 Uncharacterised protein [Mycobacteroides abscessus subsp. abscessus]